MHFYRPLRPIAAFTFDLDDTLYDNYPVVTRTQQEVHKFLTENYPELSNTPGFDLQQVRRELLEQEPEIYHDVSEWRRRAVHLALRRCGHDEQSAHKGAEGAMEVFFQWRSKIDMPQATHDTMQALAARFPLVAITNGNVDPVACGLAQYFKFILRAGPDGRAKPYPDMFQQAVDRLGLPAHSLLHVGDHLHTDVEGALRSGLQACWINDQQASLTTAKHGRLLPHLEISRLASLTALL